MSSTPPDDRPDVPWGAGAPAAPPAPEVVSPGEAPSLQPRERSEERPTSAVAGAPMALLGLGLAVVGGLLLLAGSQGVAFALLGVVVLLGAVGVLSGLLVVQPNQARVVTLFGRYVGTVREPGMWWVNPLTAGQREGLSLRVRNFQTERAKVNDAAGSPIEIAAVVVWRIDDTARAVFDVDDVEQFVVVQSESAVRHLASQYPYDDATEAGANAATLRGNAEAVADALAVELRARLDGAGLEVLEARITHLAYAPEIAESMLRRQQAQAIVAARRTIVAGAVGLVDEALAGLEERGVVELDQAARAQLVSNLMVVLTGDRGASPTLGVQAGA